MSRADGPRPPVHRFHVFMTVFSGGHLNLGRKIHLFFHQTLILYALLKASNGACQIVSYVKKYFNAINFGHTIYLYFSARHLSFPWLCLEYCIDLTSIHIHSYKMPSTFIQSNWMRCSGILEFKANFLEMFLAMRIVRGLNCYTQGCGQRSHFIIGWREVYFYSLLRSSRAFSEVGQ